MRYHVKLDGTLHELELSAAGPGRYSARLGSGESARAIEVSVLGRQPTLAVLIENRVVELVPAGAAEFGARGRRAPAQLLDPAEARSSRKASGAGAGASNVKSPMPGRIVKVMVAPGDAVDAGQPALVIEAMKMENELVCPQAGVVQKVLAEPGDAVERGALLIEIG